MTGSIKQSLVDQVQATRLSSSEKQKLTDQISFGVPFAKAVQATRLSFQLSPSITYDYNFTDERISERTG